MLKRGIKRHLSELDADVSEYARNLSHFQMAAKKRESMRIKHAVSDHPGLHEKTIKEKLAVEMALIEGTAKFIMACKNQNQTLEAAKTLLSARLRSDMLKFELNKLRRGRGSPPMKTGKPSYAGLSISDVRIPLMWRRKDHINDVGDPRRFAVFCVARIGSQIYDTTLIEPLDRDNTDITFPDVLLFSKVPPYFELTLEVYSHHLNKESTGIAATPQKLAKSISRAVGKNLLKNAKKDFENIGPKFDLVASATLTLDNCSSDIQSHELYLEDPQNDNNLPLFSQFCCRLAAMPYCCEEEVLAGNVKLRKELKMQSFWAVLMGWKMSLWTDKSLKDAARSPYAEIQVNRDTRIEDKGNDTLTLRNDGTTHEFHFEDKENLHHWLIHCIQHASDHRRWKEAAITKMEVLSPTATTANVATSKTFHRTRSKLALLYDQA